MTADSRGLVPHSRLCDRGVEQDPLPGGQGGHCQDVIDAGRVPGLAGGHHPAQPPWLAPAPPPEHGAAPPPRAPACVAARAFAEPPPVPLHVPPEPPPTPGAALAIPRPASDVAPRSVSAGAPRASARRIAAQLPAPRRAQVQTASKCQRTRNQRA